MKKIVLLTAVMMMAAASAFAAGGAATGTIDFANAGLTVVSSGDAKNIGKLSASVGLGYTGGATGYGIVTQHQKGTKAFATTFDSTAIFSKDVTTGAGASISASDSSAFGGWTAM
ncbi:hypothetical protein GMST_02800 [Geomonas silvestris]|uniref:Porin domain-containing protein n=1 Tax=Geomonas silvestris TaxID=2740184 RepID=A0A6V8MD85_9BACT|nr:hypothetical protein [Geomonas silvestris]GFO57955.1 hypothetical protein GMST_02800 [Geomonas silvestris]